MQTRLIDTENGSYTVYVNLVNANAPYTIYLHGGPGFNCYVERHELGPLLNKNLNFIWFDHLGCAESKAHSSDKLSHSNQMHDIIRVVKQITDKPVNVIGHCLGAQLTHDLMRIDPHFVRKVVWYSPVISVQQVFKRVLKRSVDEKLLDLNQLTSSELQTYNTFLKTKDEDFSGREVMALLALLPKINNFQNMYWKNKKILEKYLKYMEERPMAFDVFIKMSTDFFERGILPIPSYKDIPILILYSDDDGITPWETNGQKMLSHLPQAKTQLIPEGYHWLHLEKIDLSMKATLDFLN